MAYLEGTELGGRGDVKNKGELSPGEAFGPEVLPFAAPVVGWPVLSDCWSGILRTGCRWCRSDGRRPFRTGQRTGALCPR